MLRRAYHESYVFKPVKRAKQVSAPGDRREPGVSRAFCVSCGAAKQIMLAPLQSPAIYPPMRPMGVTRREGRAANIRARVISRSSWHPCRAAIVPLGRRS